MPAIGRDTRTTRLDQLSDDQIQARWAAFAPKLVRWSLLFCSLTVALFLFNHLAKTPQKLTDILEVAFEICAIFSVCFLFLLVAALYFRTGAWRKKSGNVH